MATKFVKLFNTKTEREGYYVRTHLMFFDRVSSRGYYAHSIITKGDGLFELSPVVGKGVKSYQLERADRFSQKRMDEYTTGLRKEMNAVLTDEGWWANDLGNGRLDNQILEVIEESKELKL